MAAEAPADENGPSPKRAKQAEGVSAPVPLWLDCDPGHDDAIALLVAAHHPRVRLIGVSTVAGNAGVDKTTRNAAKVLTAAGLAGQVQVFTGAARPLIRGNARFAKSDGDDADHLPDVEIHGETGLAGSPTMDRYEPAAGVISEEKAVLAMARIILASAEPVALVATGSLTNVALLFSLFPEVLEKISVVSLMGGAMGIGNRHPVAEYNILNDPEAARMVFDAPVKVVMVPLEVTHTALATPEVLKDIGLSGTPFVGMVVELLTFFKDSYKNIFGFESPPVHDPCAVAYVIEPSLFEARLMHVEVVTGQHSCAGQTVCDVWGYSPSKERNVHVTERMDVPGFWRMVVEALRCCDAATPFNSFDFGKPAA
eukprot:TRINITY_DN44409_c0_g1_i1.p1 TRINITY_DN44409_c0_g1~~TRINITY_DN44409_c0_g1_i1.p1  ORF type:complete len:392 (-),score=62.09 TRINITY_DN44409_c0_g1_i1:89-1195(-)